MDFLQTLKITSDFTGSWKLDFFGMIIADKEEKQ